MFSFTTPGQRLETGALAVTLDLLSSGSEEEIIGRLQLQILRVLGVGRGQELNRWQSVDVLTLLCNLCCSGERIALNLLLSCPTLPGRLLAEYFQEQRNLNYNHLGQLQIQPDTQSER